MNKVIFNYENCIKCLQCVRSCQYDILDIEKSLPVQITDGCTGCQACISACPVPNAISIEVVSEKTPANFPENIWVLTEKEPSSGTMTDGTMGLLGKATELAANSSKPCNVTAIEIKACPLEAEVDTLTAYIKQHNPDIILGNATKHGRSLIACLATRLHTGLTADCTGLEIDQENGALLQTRPAFGGNIMASIFCKKHRPQMASVRPGVFSPDSKSTYNTIKLNPGKPAGKIEILKQTPLDTINGQLQKAEIIITIGRGVGQKNIPAIYKLAEELGASVGASRAVVDSGWLEYSHQIGQTGITVQPKIYIALGVSGAIQHLVGMQSSDKIIAVNHDPDAPIFKNADIKIVAEINDILPELINITRREKHA